VISYRLAVRGTVADQYRHNILSIDAEISMWPVRRCVTAQSKREARIREVMQT
jgi:hypothetical protein